MASPGTFSAIQAEVTQQHSLRKPLLQKIKKLRGGRAIVSMFIRFWGDWPLMQGDVDMVEEVLSYTDCSKGITLIIDAPGGDGLAAERLIQVCKSYSGTDFEAIVPARAKSAATMVCLGADKILMSPTSELGPIDPQVYRKLGREEPEWIAAYHITKTYDDLFRDAVALAAGGHIEPYLQQLGNFNATDVAQLKAAQALAENIAISSLKNGMLSAKTEIEIKDAIKPFTDPEATMSHGRALNHKQVKDCGLNVELMPVNDELWKTVWSLYVRSKFVVDGTTTAKLVETDVKSQIVSAQQ
jgi:hypothetical protein